MHSASCAFWRDVNTVILSGGWLEEQSETNGIVWKLKLGEKLEAKKDDSWEECQTDISGEFYRFSLDFHTFKILARC